MFGLRNPPRVELPSAGVCRFAAPGAIICLTIGTVLQWCVRSSTRQQLCTVIDAERLLSWLSSVDDESYVLVKEDRCTTARMARSGHLSPSWTPAPSEQLRQNGPLTLLYSFPKLLCRRITSNQNGVSPETKSWSRCHRLADQKDCDRVWWTGQRDQTR